MLKKDFIKMIKSVKNNEEIKFYVFDEEHGTEDNAFDLGEAKVVCIDDEKYISLVINSNRR